MNRKSFLFMALIAIFANACSDEDDKTTTDPGDDNPPAETPSCVSDDRQCGTDGVPELCLVDSWVKQDPCDADKKCLDGYCVPKDTKECDNGTKGCSKQGVPQICENETWKKLDACSADKHCFDGECVIQTSSVCTDGAHQCSADGVPQICQNQGWVTLDACKNHEVCNKATGACEAAAACDSERCRTMGQDQYAGNVCIQGENGTQCGCYFDEDCNDGYTCDQNLSQCTKADTPPTPQEPSEACLWHAGSYACDGDSLISCSLDGAVISREHCPSSSGSAYLGEKCILHTNDGSLSCGCNSNSDCKFGYECGSDSYCSKKECTSQACSSQSGKQYVGNVCVASYIEGVEDCGCKSNDDCKDGYTCDTVMRRCQESGQPAKSVCHDLSNGSFVCQDTEMIFCHNGNESSRVACRDMIDGEYLGNTCIDSTGICGCKNDYFCKDGLVCEDNRCVKPTCTDAACKKKSGNAYMGDVCIDDDLATTTNGKSCGCLSDTDCKSGYKCHPAMGICYAEIPQGKTGICDGVQNDMTVCSGNDVVFCYNHVESQRWTCSDVSFSYSGNACLSEYDFCGCKSDSDCSIGFGCKTESHICVPAACSAAACKAQTGDVYMGDACVHGWYDNTEVCGCTGDSDCKTGYHCNEIVGICAKSDSTTPTSFCKDKTVDNDYCDGNDIVYCENGREITREKCSDLSDDFYMGDACLKEKDYCGCTTNSDCKAGFECKSNMCEKLSCYESNCMNAKDDDYLGNVCVDAYGDKMCGCNSNDDCRLGYECDPIMLICKISEGKVGICQGKPEDFHTCDGNTVVYCANDRVATRYYCQSDASTPEETFVGNICVKDLAACGCNTNRECNFKGKSSYICNSEHVCIKKCSEDQCKAQASSQPNSYKGDACVAVPNGSRDEKECGCLSQSDCANGYVCNDFHVCVKSSCRDAACKSRSENYAGDICISRQSGSDPWDCGCKQDSDCREGYTCDAGTKTCSKSSEPNICASKDGKHVCDGNARQYCVKEEKYGDPEPCNTMVGAAYSGNLCMESTGECGCKAQTDCKDGYECQNGVCTKEPSNPCKDLKDTTVCDGNELVYCGNKVEIKRQSCSDSTIISGTICKQTKPDNKYACGCSSDSDCYAGFKCGSSLTCINGSIDHRSPGNLSCDDIINANSSIVSCNGNSGQYTIKDKYETVIELNVNTNTSRNYSLSQTGKHSIKMTNLRSGARVFITWGFDDSVFMSHDRVNNQLKVSDGVNVQYYNATNNGDNSIDYRLDKSSKTLTIEHAGSGSESLVVKQIMVL